MGFKDLIKSSVLQGFVNADITVPHILTVLSVAAVLAIYIFTVYRIRTRNGFYNLDFNIALALLPIITAGVVLALQSSLVMSLGMVGALSIVRFRTAIKDAMDLCFLFWAVAVGMICGSGLYALACIISGAVTVLLLALSLVRETAAPCILSARVDAEHAADFIAAAKKQCRSFAVKSRSVSAAGCEIVAEVRVKNEDKFLDFCLCTEGCRSASLLSGTGSVIRG